MAHVFLGYSRKDKEFMERLRADLIAEGLEVWTDEALEPGTPLWTKKVEEAVEHAGCLVVLLSPDAKQSTWVRRELLYAGKFNVRIFPLLVRGDDKNAIPIEIEGAQWLDARRDYEGALRRLVDALCRHLDVESRSQQRRREEEERRRKEAELARRRAEEERIKQAKAEEERRRQEEAELARRRAEEEKLRLLPPWNPLDHLRLLWWIFMAPGHLKAYRERAGEEAVKRMGAWLASTLIWLPLFILTLASSLGTLPVSIPDWYWVVYASLGLGWLLTGWLGARLS